MYKEDKHIVVEQDGHHLSLDAKGWRLLDARVSQRRVEAVGDAQHGPRLAQTRKAAIRDPSRRMVLDEPPDPQWFRTANAGLLPVLRHLAAAEGLEVHREIYEPGITQLPDPADVSGLVYPSLAEFAFLHERGLIRLPETFDAADVIRELLRAFPQRRIVILGGKTGVLQSLYCRLNGDYGKDGCPGGMALVDARGVRDLNGDGDWRTSRVALATFKGAGELNFASSDIVLLLDARDSMRDDGQLALEQVDAQFRLFGIIRESDPLAPSQRDRLMTAFGPQLIDLQSHGRVRRTAQVEWISNPKPQVRLTPGDPQFFSRCYFRNDVRNRRIGQLAMQRFSHKSRPNVTILVEHLDHAIELGKKLPDWPILNSGDVDTFGLPGSMRTRLKQGRLQPPGRCQIVLADMARRFPGYDSDVVLMASGGPHVARLPASWLYQKEGQARPLRIIDFRDRFHHQTDRWSRQRRRNYAERDLFDVGVMPVVGRIRRYLEEQARDSRRQTQQHGGSR